MDPLTRQVVTGAAALWLVEGAVRLSTPFDLSALTWRPAGGGFALWQPLTCYFVQGADLLGGLISLIVLRFLVPTMQELLPRRQLAMVLGAAIAGGTALAGLVTAAGLGTGSIYGWSGMLFPALTLFGLAQPQGQVNLYFLLRMRAGSLVWASLAIALISVVAAFAGRASTLFAAHELGMWLGVYGWWQLRRRRFRTAGATVQPQRPQKTVRNFHVIDGGRTDDRTWH